MRVWTTAYEMATKSHSCRRYREGELAAELAETAEPQLSKKAKYGILGVLAAKLL